MNKILRGYSMKVMLPKILAVFVVAVILLGIACPGLILLLGGAADISQVDLEDSKGDLVSFDASQIIVAIATLSSTDGDGNTEVLETHYLLPDGNGKYLTVLDKKNNNENVLSRAMEQSEQYYLYDLETLTRLGDLQGTVKPLDEDMYSYITDCITNYQLPGYSEDANLNELIIPVQIELNQVGFLSETMALILGVLGLVFAIVGVILLMPVLSGKYQRKAFAALGTTQEEAEEAFAAAEVIENVRVGKYIWYQKGATTHSLISKNLIWGYTMPEPLVVSKYRWVVALYDMDQRQTQVCFMDKKSCETFLTAIENQGNPFVKGYTANLAQQFQNSFQKFVEDAKK